MEDLQKQLKEAKLIYIRRTDNSRKPDDRYQDYYDKYKTVRHYTNENSPIYKKPEEIAAEKLYRENLFKRFEPPSQQLNLSLLELDIDDAILDTFSNFDEFFQDTIHGQIIPMTEEPDIPSPVPEFDNDINIQINNETIQQFFDNNPTVLFENSYEENDNKFVENFNFTLTFSKVIDENFGVFVSNYIKVYFLKKFEEFPNDVNLISLMLEIGKFSYK